MSFSINTANMNECAAVIRKANADLDAAREALEEVVHLISNDADDILTKYDYEEKIGLAVNYLAERHADLEKFAATMDKMVEYAVDAEQRAIRALRDADH